MFGKITYKKVKLPFHYIKEEVDCDAGAISIEAFGDIDGEKIFLYMTFVLTNSYMYDREIIISLACPYPPKKEASLLAYGDSDICAILNSTAKCFTPTCSQAVS